jgi:hypothetical protein
MHQRRAQSAPSCKAQILQQPTDTRRFKMDIHSGASQHPATRGKKGRLMRNLLVLFVIGISGAAYSQTARQPFTITLSTDMPTIKAGEPVYVDVVMRNTSDHDVDCTTWQNNALDKNYQYDVTFEDGKPARNIDKHTTSSSTWPCILKPGKSDTPSGGMLSTIFDFSRPGKYTIQVTRKIWGDENRPETSHSDYHQPDVKSNTIVITVVPAADPPPAQR